MKNKNKSWDLKEEYIVLMLKDKRGKDYKYISGLMSRTPHAVQNRYSLLSNGNVKSKGKHPKNVEEAVEMLNKQKIPVPNIDKLIEDYDRVRKENLRKDFSHVAEAEKTVEENKLMIAQQKVEELDRKIAQLEGVIGTLEQVESNSKIVIKAQRKRIEELEEKLSALSNDPDIIIYKGLEMLLEVKQHRITELESDLTEAQGMWEELNLLRKECKYYRSFNERLRGENESLHKRVIDLTNSMKQLL